MYITNSTTGGLMLQTMLYLANQSSNAAVNTLYDFPPAPKSDLNEVKCYGIYGCFPLNGPWTTLTRQINVHPQPPSEIGPHFTVFSSRNLENPKFIDLNEPERVKDLGINPNGKLFFIVHGYLESGDRPWMRDMTKSLLQNEMEGSASVVLIDWGGGSSPPYVQAVANIRLVGAITAHLIHMIHQELNMKNLDNVHMIGHSLGSHLCGYTGYFLQKDFGLKLGRISGLDPAAPLFSETDQVVRLDRSDAKFVDVIHTDANPLMSGGLGMVKRIGHVDFYPNGGFDNPGCGLKFQEYMNNKDNTFFNNVQEFLGCNHVRSYQFFAESLHSKCHFTGITCDSFESFKAGRCAKCGEDGHHCLDLGYNSYTSYRKLIDAEEITENTPLVVYQMTGDRKPFCRSHYKMTVKISASDESVLHGGEIGTLSVKLHSKKRKATEKMQFSKNPLYFEPGSEHFAIVPGKNIRDPYFGTVYWEYQTNFLNPLTWRILSSPRVYIDYILIESMENDMRLKLCPLQNAPVITGHENVFEEKYCDE